MTDSCFDIVFPAACGREVVCRFDGGDLTSDAGLLLVAEADLKLGLTESMAGVISDRRQQGKVRHSVLELLRERVYAIAGGYEDVNDLDVDDTEDPCHRQQELEFFNGYHGGHCYIPLYIHLTAEDSRQWLLGTLLRSGNSCAAKGLLAALRIAVRLLRDRFPDVAITVRGDSAFGIWDVMKFCEAMGLGYVLGLNRNKALDRLSTPVQMDTALKYKWEGDGCREYGEFGYKAKTWDGERRVIVKSEIPIDRDELNPRFVVTNLTQMTPEEVYAFYCRRANQENRIKEMKLDLASGRTSCHRFLANQCRLLLHTAACALMGVLQEALSGTRWAAAQVGTMRLRLLKVGARVVETCRRIWFHLPSSYTEQEIWRHIRVRLAEGAG